MSVIHKYRCEICGVERNADGEWLMAEVLPSGILVSHWREDRAQAQGVRHFCEPDHAQIYVARYLSSPGKFATSQGALNPKEQDLTQVQSHLLNKVMQQPGEMSLETEEIFDLLAAAEAALKGKVTIDSLNGERFDA